MKLFQIITLLILLIAPSSFGQNRGERVAGIKIAFLTERLNLDLRTAEQFWPLYHQYDEEIRRLIEDKRKGNDLRTAEEILDQEQKAIDIKRRYSSQFLKVISNDQLNKLFQSERDFNRILIKRMNRMEERKERNPEQRELNTERNEMNSGRRREEMRAPMQDRPMRRPVR